MFGHEGIHCLPLDILVAVLLLREMGILHFVQCAEIPVDGLCIGVFHLGGVLGPVATDGDEFQRSRCGKGGDLGIVGFKLGRLVDRHAALAMATAEKMCGDHDDWHAHCHALVNGCQQEGLRAATRATCHADELLVHLGQGFEEIHCPHTAPGLQGEGL